MRQPKAIHFAKGLALSSLPLQNGERKLHAVFAWLPSLGFNAIFATPGLTVRGLTSRSRQSEPM
jgi:hypothetical protein